MKKLLLILCAISSLPICAGKEFDRFIKSANTRRLRGLATVLFYKERAITANFKEADAKIDVISEQARLTGIPEEIQEELSSIKSPTNRSQEQVKILNKYYKDVMSKLSKKERFFFDTEERPLPESLIASK